MKDERVQSKDELMAMCIFCTEVANMSKKASDEPFTVKDVVNALNQRNFTGFKEWQEGLRSDWMTLITDMSHVSGMEAWQLL